jgi:hypothetical protein
MAEAQQAPAAVPAEAASWNKKQGRPKLSERRFRSVAVEEFLIERKARIGDPVLAGAIRQLFS